MSYLLVCWNLSNGTAGICECMCRGIIRDLIQVTCYRTLHSLPLYIRVVTIKGFTVILLSYRRNTSYSYLTIASEIWVLVYFIDVKICTKWLLGITWFNFLSGVVKVNRTDIGCRPLRERINFSCNARNVIWNLPREIQRSFFVWCDIFKFEFKYYNYATCFFRINTNSVYDNV